jgi:hypothetical protein
MSVRKNMPHTEGCSVCQACGNTIKAGEIEYDLVTPAATLRLDGRWYAIFLYMQSTTYAEHHAAITKVRIILTGHNPSARE